MPGVLVKSPEACGIPGYSLGSRIYHRLWRLNRDSAQFLVLPTADHAEAHNGQSDGSSATHITLPMFSALCPVHHIPHIARPCTDPGDGNSGNIKEDQSGSHPSSIQITSTETAVVRRKIHQAFIQHLSSIHPSSIDPADRSFLCTGVGAKAGGRGCLRAGAVALRQSGDVRRR
jgi:hypothetical protein